MNARFLALCVAATLLLAGGCSSLPPRARTGPIQAGDFEATIARIRRTDPGSPALLNAQLAYGEYLLSAAPGPCASRIVLAQEQLGTVAVSPMTRLMYPEGWAAAADLEYRLHLARAACGSAADSRDDVLAAIAAARHAVELYRNEFDYRSMAIMQFNVALALRQLGRNATATGALETALAMDREYGFRDDAQQNYKLLLTWRGEPAGAAQVAGLMRDFPRRQVILKFGWHASDAQITFANTRECLQDGQLLQSHAAAAFERHIAANHAGGWSVSYTHRVAGYQPGVWPTERGPPLPQLTFTAATIPAAAFRVSATGQFENTEDSKVFSAHLVTRANALIKAGAPASHDARGLLRDALESTDSDLSPGVLEAQTTENYQLETAMWIGAQLQQGVWYEMSDSLALPGLPYIFAQQRIEFAFTRRVPCTAGETAPTCVEIVFHATPEENSLNDVLADIGGDYVGTHPLEYYASIQERIVVDPANLFAYARDEKTFWYASIGPRKGETMLNSEHLVSTTRYH